MSKEEKKNILDENVEQEDLDAVSGGITVLGNPFDSSGAWGAGGCTDSFYAEKCTDTVERGSWCWTGDYCSHWSNTYTLADKKAK